jgi:hypothetical protein
MKNKDLNKKEFRDFAVKGQGINGNIWTGIYPHRKHDQVSN